MGVIPAGGIVDVVLQWSDAEGNSGNNYNLGLWNVTNGGYLATSLNPQNGTQNPIESFRWTNNTGAAVSVAVTVDDQDNPASRDLELFVLPRNFALANLTDPLRVSANSVFGQGAVLDAIIVGAINANDPGNDTIANYTNQGTSTIYTNFVSQSSTMRNSLDGAGVDGVQTRIGQLGSLSMDGDDETDFLAFYNSQNSAANLNGDSAVDQADYDAFYELLNFGIDLDVIS